MEESPRKEWAAIFGEHTTDEGGCSIKEIPADIIETTTSSHRMGEIDAT